MMLEPMGEPTNAWRAERAAHAVQTYIEQDGGSSYGQEDPQTHLGDMLCDLMHWADEQGIDFERAMLNAESNHDAEVAEES